MSDETSIIIIPRGAHRDLGLLAKALLWAIYENVLPGTERTLGARRLADWAGVSYEHGRITKALDELTEAGLVQTSTGAKGVTVSRPAKGMLCSLSESTGESACSLSESATALSGGAPLLSLEEQSALSGGALYRKGHIGHEVHAGTPASSLGDSLKEGPLPQSIIELDSRRGGLQAAERQNLLASQAKDPDGFEEAVQKLITKKTFNWANPVDAYIQKVMKTLKGAKKGKRNGPKEFTHERSPEELDWRSRNVVFKHVGS